MKTLLSFCFVILVIQSTNVHALDMRDLMAAKEIKSNDPSDDKLGVKNLSLLVSQTLLKKKLLLTTSLIEGPPVALGESLRTKVVFFEYQDNKLFLFEDTSGIVFSKSIPAKKLLVSFPVLKLENGQYEIDFRKGMNRLIYAGEYHATDFAGLQRESEVRIEVTSSFLNKIVAKKDYVFLDQLVQARFPKSGGFEEKAVQIKYTLRPYKPTKDFPSKLSSKQHKIGYFEVSPVYTPGTGHETVRIMKYNTSKPVVFHLSSNTPKDYKQAVTDGILHWNKVFKKEVFKVADLPKGVSVHEPGFNIVQWVDFDTAGFAYADMQADPFTGELLQTHVYMTSVFALGGISKARQLLMKLKAANEKTVENKVKFEMRGFNRFKTCFHHTRSNLIGSLSVILEDEKSTDETVKRFAQDYVRGVMAHEIGHTIGLRHNFSGSLFSNIKVAERENVLKEYLKSGKIDKETTPTSSVMDYHRTEDEVLVGAHIRLGQNPFAYDQAAVNWGYSDQKIEEVEAPLFCTDTKQGTTNDCRVWDSGKNPSLTVHNDGKIRRINLAWELAFLFLGGKMPLDAKKTKKAQEIVLSPENVAASLALDFGEFLNFLREDTRFVSLEAPYRFLSDFNKKVLKDKTAKKQKKIIGELGGLTEALDAYFDETDEEYFDFLNKGEKQFKKIILDPNFTKGMDLFGNPFEFTLSEIIYMNEAGERFFKILREKALPFYIEALKGSSKAKKYRAFQGVDPLELENFLGVLVEDLVLFTGEDTISGKLGSKSLKVKKYFYPLKLRVQAAGLLNNSLFPKWNDFGVDSKTKMLEEMKKTKIKLVGTDDKVLKINDLPRSIRRWARDEEAVMKALK